MKNKEQIKEQINKIKDNAELAWAAYAKSRTKFLPK